VIPSLLQTQGAWRASPPPISIRDMLLSRLAEKPGGRSSVTSVRDVELEILEVVGIGSIIASCGRGYNL